MTAKRARRGFVVESRASSGRRVRERRKGQGRVRAEAERERERERENVPPVTPSAFSDSSLPDEGENERKVESSGFLRRSLPSMEAGHRH